MKWADKKGKGPKQRNLWVIVMLLGYYSTTTVTFPHIFYPYNIKLPGVSLHLFPNNDGNSLSFCGERAVQRLPKCEVWLLRDCILWVEIGFEVFHKLYLQRKPRGNVFRLNSSRGAHKQAAHSIVSSETGSQTPAWKQNVQHSRSGLYSIMNQLRWLCCGGSAAIWLHIN